MRWSIRPLFGKNVPSYIGIWTIESEASFAVASGYFSQELALVVCA